MTQKGIELFSLFPISTPKKFSLVVLLVLSFSMGSCQTLAQPTLTTSPISEAHETKQVVVSVQPVEEKLPVELSSTIEIKPTQDPDMRLSFGYTYHRADGNRYVVGSAPLHLSNHLDIPLDGRPAWLAAAEGSQGAIWVVVLEDGRVQAFQVNQNGYQEIPITPERLSPGAPPLLMVRGDVPSLVTAPVQAASTLTHPIVLPKGNGKIAYIEKNGDLVIWDDEEIARLPVDALPDARLIMDERGRILVFSGPTERYDHGVLGDVLEASRITLVETRPEPRLAKVIQIEKPFVIEGTAPIWVDLTGDSQREIIVTRSHPQEGAQVVVYDEYGEILAEGAFIGRGYRWRNQLAVGPFGPEGEMEIVDVLTPHINGVAEFYRIIEEELKILADFPGYTSHVIGTRNLDMGLAGDFDGDGRPEVLLPNQARSELGAIRHGVDGASLAWQLDLAGVLSTNLAAISFMNGSLALGAGREDGTLWVWSSQKE